MYFEFLERPRQPATTWSPTVDVCERPAEIVVFVEMPGVERTDIQLAWNDGVLIISGLKRQQGEGDGGGAAYLCVERTYGHFRREISMKIPVDPKRAKAELKNGLLEIHLPKRTEADVSTIPIL